MTCHIKRFKKELEKLSHTTFTDGDVFVSVSNGKVQWRHPDGTLNQTLDTGFAGAFTTGMAFDSVNRLYVTGFNANRVAVFNTDGSLAGTFGSGFNADPESILFDAAGNAYVGQADGTRQLLKFDAAGNPLTSFSVATEDRGSDWIDLAADQCTMFYTSEGFQIKRFNVCTNTQLPDFATLPNRPAYALRILPDGGVLVADTVNILRLDAAGNVIQTYNAPGETDWFALNLDPDGTSFWSASFATSNVYKFDIATGNVLLKFNTGTPTNTVFGLGIKGEPTAATGGCPIANPQTCCQIVVEFKTQLVPPALDLGDNTIRNLNVEVVGPVIESVCPEKVIICGKVRKTFEYTAVSEDGTQTTKTITDERPFQCVIDRDDANGGDKFEVVGSAVLCEGTPQVQNSATRPGPNDDQEHPVKVFWKVLEKDIIKVCIRKV